MAVLSQNEIESLTSVPKHNCRRSERRGVVDRRYRVFQRELPNRWIIGCHRAVLENRVGKKGGRVHTTLQTDLLRAFFCGVYLGSRNFDIVRLIIGHSRLS